MSGSVTLTTPVPVDGYAACTHCMLPTLSLSDAVSVLSALRSCESSKEKIIEVATMSSSPIAVYG